MSWIDYLSESERRAIYEKKSKKQFAQIARKGLWTGLLFCLNQDRKRQNLPPLKRPPSLPGASPTGLEKVINDKIEAIITSLDERTGSHGSSSVAWIDQQLDRLISNFTK